MGDRFLEIDGSFGEGGGQILRTSLSLSCVLKKPFRISRIRKNRAKPGLMPQHLMCVRALARISDAEVKGDNIGATELSFKPGRAIPGEYFFDIGTAGSTTLLLQAILPALASLKAGSRITLRGGTHVPFSPPFHYLDQVFIPLLNSIGLRVGATLEAYGFYPKGGGVIRAWTSPLQELELKPFNPGNRGAIKKITGVSGVIRLPLTIAERQRTAALETVSPQHVTEIGLFEGKEFGPGTFIFLRPEGENCVAGFSSIGERGKRAELVGKEAAQEMSSFLDSGACLDFHIADQIVPYLAFARGPSSFTLSRITDHLITNLHVTKLFTGLKSSIEGEKGRQGRVVLVPMDRQ